MDRSIWHFQRTRFAEQVIANYEWTNTQTLFSPRRTGKTQFVMRDLVPAAESSGLTPVYVDMWANRNEPAESLVQSLRRAHEQFTVPRSRTMRTLKQPVTGVRVLGTGLSLGPVHESNEPDNPLSKIAFWLESLLGVIDGEILLIVDEAQSMATAPDGGDVAAALRSVLQIHDQAVLAFFTGSSQHNLARLLDDASAPFYQFGQRLNLPRMEREFSDFICERFEHAAPHLSLDRTALYDALCALDHMPGPFVEMVKNMLMAGDNEVSAFLAAERAAVDDRVEAMIESRKLSLRELAVAARIAHGLPYSSRAALDYCETIEGTGQRLLGAQVQRCLNKLINAGLVDRGYGHGEVFIATSAFGEYLRRRFKKPAE